MRQEARQVQESCVAALVQFGVLIGWGQLTAQTLVDLE